MNIYKVLPALGRTRQMALWHKALESQWSAEDLDWNAPQRLSSSRRKDELAHVLTPILIGEQAALYSVASQIVRLGHRSEVEGQFYLTTWAVDEARHTELFARFYRRLDREPGSIRKFPAGYLVQSRIAADDPADWLSGVLVSEVFAKAVMTEFRRVDLDPVLSEIADGVLVDEARHLGFNHLYLEERFAEVYRRDLAAGDGDATRLRARLRSVIEGARPLLRSLAGQLGAMGISSEQLLADVEEETARRLESSIARGLNVATGARPASQGASAAD